MTERNGELRAAGAGPIRVQIHTNYVVVGGAEIVEALTAQQAIGVCGGALRASLAAILLYFCALDWPSTLAWSEFDALPAVTQAHVVKAAAPAWLVNSGADGLELWRQAQGKGKAGADFVAAHGRELLRPHPFCEALKRALGDGAATPIPRLLRSCSAQIAGVIAAWLAFELMLVAARMRARPP